MMIPPTFLISSKEFQRQMANEDRMFFAPSHHQDKQRATARFNDADGGVISHKKTGCKFRMLPGGRWVEETVYHRIANNQRLPGDPT